MAGRGRAYPTFGTSGVAWGNDEHKGENALPDAAFRTRVGTRGYVAVGKTACVRTSTGAATNRFAIYSEPIASCSPTRSVYPRPVSNVAARANPRPECPKGAAHQSEGLDGETGLPWKEEVRAIQP